MQVSRRPTGCWGWIGKHLFQIDLPAAVALFISRIHPAVEGGKHHVFDVGIERLDTLNASPMDMPVPVNLRLVLDHQHALEGAGDFVAQHFAWPFVGDGGRGDGRSVRHGQKQKTDR
jgi:hypothetical protein